ncbi:hypothetical protein ACWEQL_13195 [Kitasatospora sp. NPDC004240]
MVMALADGSGPLTDDMDPLSRSSVLDVPCARWPGTGVTRSDLAGAFE